MKFSLKCLKALLLVSSIALGTTYAQSRGEVVITGQIPGAKDGTPIRLVRMEDKEDKIQFATGAIEKGTFALKGELIGPTVVYLRVGQGKINAKGLPDRWASIPMMLEQGKVKVKVVHIDSIPLEYGDQGPISFNRKNVDVQGAGKIQAQYEEYLARVKDADFKVWKAERTATDYFMSGGARLDSLSKLHYKIKVQEIKKDSIADVFMRQHPMYAVSAWIGLKQAKSQFTYSGQQLQDMTVVLKDNPDQNRYQQILVEVEKNKAFALHVPFGDLQVETPTGEVKQMVPLMGMNKGKYTLVDFWASWCGPCRSAIPHVRSLHQQYGQQLEIVAASLDEKAANWKKAMDDEKMEWTQVILPGKSANEIMGRFNINSIPTLMMVNPAGEVVLLTNSSDEISAYIKKNL
ncbi:MAG: DUF4369 domain-containing protein [Sphingobacterium sp.]|jgi:thiol-disulfide isomerase/thioredoxin|nr:DUF4369 domain-containing protein [Sphingobacterium sp.]